VSHLTFRGPGHRLVAFGLTLLCGQTGEFTEAEARALEMQGIRMDDPDRAARAAADAEEEARERDFLAEREAKTKQSAGEQTLAAAGDTDDEPSPSEPEAGNGEGHSTDPTKET
jgi:hypothetical protein